MKKMSKIFSVFLAILMVFCALPISATAQDVTFTVTSSVNDVKAGDTITINVDLTENSKLGVITANVVFDDSKLEYVSHNLYEIGAEKIVNPTYADGKIRFVIINAEPITTGGTILSINFKALSSSCNSVSLNIVEALDKNADSVDTVSVPAIIHSYGEWITEANPTCENAGQKSKSCACGEKITESIDALGHDYATEYTVDKDATCTEKGSKSQHCSRCESKQNITEIPAIGHDYKEEITKVPTHTENGEKTFTCSNCGDSYKEVINADGTHKHISAVTKASTCTEKGVMTYTCACGDTYTEEIPMVAHTETTLSAVAPTCTQTGLTEGAECSVCGEILTAQTVIPEKGHTEVTLYAVAPTCTQTGLTEGIKCSDCGTVLDAQEEIPATGHVPNSKGNCDTCGEKICDHNCHKGGISGFFWKIANFFNKLFGSKKYCECGYAHY